MNVDQLLAELRALLDEADDPAFAAALMVSIARLEAARLDTPHPVVHTAHHDDVT